MNTIENCTITIDVDLSLLKCQKSVLLHMIARLEQSDNLREIEYESLEGMINLCDGIQNYAVDVIGLPENEVFNLTNE